MKNSALSHRRSHQFVTIFEHVDRLKAGGHIGHGHGAGEQERPSALPQPIDDHLTAGHHAADHAKSLAHRADFDIDFAMQAKVIDDAAPTLAEHAFAMRVIDHQQDIVLLGDFAKRGAAARYRRPC